VTTDSSKHCSSIAIALPGSMKNSLTLVCLLEYSILYASEILGGKYDLIGSSSKCSSKVSTTGHVDTHVKK
jgi:hypothetical protein